MGFFEAIPPTSCVIKGKDGYCTHEQACILPTVKVPDCSCEGTNFTVLPGKPVILITINGCFDLHQPLYELKVISPGFSTQAFAKLLEHRTKIGGRSGHINGDTLQRSFLDFSYASFEEDQLCCGASFTCPACTPEMLAVSADGSRKLYRFR
ncbi:hypothetical protein PDJAM_G00125790 [Pangasius djambal]|uniref:Uncharacterized protein n=1 Tax=Pangasius djambal TaxID=1691987 RepID=A0ACC5ZAH2_9TELE|nr:hypothetical protein [Pangasius djambal]